MVLGRCVTWSESDNQSSWLRELPAAEEAAGDSFLELHPEHVSARCSEFHALIRLKVVVKFGWAGGVPFVR